MKCNVCSCVNDANTWGRVQNRLIQPTINETMADGRFKTITDHRNHITKDSGMLVNASREEKLRINEKSNVDIDRIDNC